MRRAGTLPYIWLTDSTRMQRKPRSYGSIEEALQETAQFYRKALWRDADCYVEFWIEKDALSGVVFPITAHYDVPLMVARGYSSITFLNAAAEHLSALQVPAFIYHLGDYDPSGVGAANKIEEDLRGYAPNADITFERLAVTREQVSAWRLPTRPTKMTDTRAKGFGDISVELDAIEPATLRALVLDAIERHLPEQRLDVLKAAEESERAALLQFISGAQA